MGIDGPIPAFLFLHTDGEGFIAQTPGLRLHGFHQPGDMSASFEFLPDPQGGEVGGGSAVAEMGILAGVQFQGAFPHRIPIQDHPKGNGLAQIDPLPEPLPPNGPQGLAGIFCNVSVPEQVKFPDRDGAVFRHQNR